MPHRIVLVLPLLALLATLLAACGGGEAGPATPQTSGVTRTSLGSVEAGRVKDQELGLSRVTVAPGGNLDPHTHPGTQVAYIESGTLSYTVLVGEVTATHRAPNGATTFETVRTGQTVRLQAGDSIVETRTLVHRARNDGEQPVVIFSSTLLDKGSPGALRAGD